jgi:hypothetical protein
VDVAAVASTNVFVYNRRSEIIGATMRNESSLYDYDWQGNRLTATNGATGAVYTPDILNQYDAVNGTAPVYDLDGSAPSEARRFLRGGSPRRVRTSHPLVPSVGTMEEESNPNEVV